MDHCIAHRDRGGILLLLVSALAFSTAGFFTRIAPVPLCPMVFWRNMFGCAGLLVLLIGRRERGASTSKGLNRREWAIVACSAFATVCYLAAFARTSVADISIIYATAPMMAAGLAWVALGERPQRRTLIAAALALAGVVVTMTGAASNGTVAGDGLALLMTAALSCVAVLARRSALPPLATAFGSSLLAAMAILPMAALMGADLRIGLHEAMWLAMFGVVTMTIALPTYLAGAVRVPAARAMLISAAELPFAPLWVWLAFGETPTRLSAIGGVVVLVAVLGDIAGRPGRHGAEPAAQT